MNDLSISLKLPLRETVRVVIVRDDGCVCYTEKKSRHSGLYCYAFPGGGVERGETHEQAIAREALEEVGIIIVDIVPMHYASKVEHTLANPERAPFFSGTKSTYYIARYAGEDRSIMEPLKGAKICWSTPKDLLNRFAFADESLFNATRMDVVKLLMKAK
jgi:8-oxo-dGTP pyrophosphatase MutT (NUDIX family)